MRDDPTNGGTFHSDDRRVYRRAAGPAADADVLAEAKYALHRSVIRDLGVEFLKSTIPVAVTGPEWAVQAALEQLIVDSSRTPQQRRFASFALGTLEGGAPVAALLDQALALFIREAAQSRINKVQQHATSASGPGARGARAGAARAVRGYREAAEDHALRHQLREGQRVARPTVRPVTADEVIA